MRQVHNVPVVAVDPEHLLTLLAVAESGSESAAAELLGIGQSSVSRRLAGLQQSSEEPLTTRTATGIRPTAAGERLLPYARAIRTALQASQRAVAPEASRPLSFRIGVSEHAALGVGAQFMAALAARGAAAQDAHVEYLQEQSFALLGRLRGGPASADGALDAAIALDAPASHEPGFTAERLGADDLMLISTRAIESGSEPDLDELRAATLLLPPSGSQVHARALAELAAAGLHLRNRVIAPGPAALKAAVLAGAGMGVTLASCCASEVAAGWLFGYTLQTLLAAAGTASGTSAGTAGGGARNGSVDVWLLLADHLPPREAAVVTECARRAANALARPAQA